MQKHILDDLLTTLPDAPVQTVRIGTHWTAVVVERQGRRHCGLASSLEGEDCHQDNVGPAVPQAGRLHLQSSRALAELVHSASPPEVSVGMATINALLSPQEKAWVDLNAGEVIAQGPPRELVNDPTVRQAYLGHIFRGDEFDRN